MTLHACDTEVEARIAEVKPVTSHGDAERVPFSVLFISETEKNYGQQIYSIRHPDLGEVDLFLVPLGPRKTDAGTGMSYEAVFT